MSRVSPISPELPHSGVPTDTIRPECWQSNAGEAIPIPPSALPPSPPTPPPTSSDRQGSAATPNNKESARFLAETPAFSNVLTSTPHVSSNRLANRKCAANRRASPFPLLIPTELTLSIVRESPLTAVEEFTCKDHDNGKEDSVGSTRVAAAAATNTERRCTAYGTSRGISVAEEILSPREHTMGACTSKKSSQHSKQSDQKLQRTPVRSEEPAEPDYVSNEEEEEEPAELPKFMLKRDSIAVTKVRMMRTHVHQENTIGEEEEHDEQNESEKGEDHVHFDNEVGKQSIPNDSGVSLNSCPENDDDLGAMRFSGKWDSPHEISLASNVTIRSLRRDRIVDDGNRSFDFKTIRERTKQLLENQLKRRIAGCGCDLCSDERTPPQANGRGAGSCARCLRHHPEDRFDLLVDQHHYCH